MCDRRGRRQVRSLYFLKTIALQKVKRKYYKVCKKINIWRFLKKNRLKPHSVLIHWHVHLYNRRGSARDLPDPTYKERILHTRETRPASAVTRAHARRGLVVSALCAHAAATSSCCARSARGRWRSVPQRRSLRYHPPAVTASGGPTVRLDRNVSNVAVGRPFVITSANC